LFEARPLFVMIASQSLNVAVLPATVACIFYLGNRADLMGAYRHKAGLNICLVAIFLFALVTSFMGFQGLLGMIGS
jgi:manganese transport protein